jgi:hypothetical protein
MNKFFTLIIFISSLAAQAQVPEGFPLIGKSDIPGAKFKPSRQFTGESLFGYMDGGAELYLEYGIKSAAITELDIKDGHYKCEVYKMNGPDEAFGIFSVSKYKCTAMPPVSAFTCQTRYQLQICKGNYYISIINKSGSREDSVNSLRIADILALQITEPSAGLSDYLPGTDLAEKKSHAVLVMGKLGLMNGAQDLEDYFTDITDYTAVILPQHNSNIISVRFKNTEALNKFTALHNWDPAKLSDIGTDTYGDASVKLLKDNHLYISTSNSEVSSH